jgi:hypothetical protein
MKMSEREKHIKVLEQFLHDYQEWGEDLELEETIKYAISSLKIDEAYQFMYEKEETYTKNDIIAMLKDLLMEIKHTVTIEKDTSSNEDLVKRNNMIKIVQFRIDKLINKKESKN